MKKHIPIIVIVLLSTILNAQNWCSPTSEWYYTRVTISGPGYAKINYTGTVTINSQTCQQLTYYSQIYQYPSGPINTYTAPPYYTYQNNNVVFLYNQINNTFDTLYNYNAIIGNKWLLPANYSYTFLPTCNKTLLTVLDTGHQIIQSVNLKWLKVQIGSPTSQIDTIFERFGLLNNYFLNYDNCTSSYDASKGGVLRCFNDNQIINYKRIPQSCNYFYSTLSIEKNSTENHSLIFPNPTTGLLNIECEILNNTNLKFQLLNNLGQIVREEEIKNANITINIQQLPIGIYFLKINNNSKTFKIIKISL